MPPVYYQDNARIHRGMVDTHTHLSAIGNVGPEVDPLALLAFLKSRGAGLIVDVAIEPIPLSDRKDRSHNYDQILFSSGIHPSSTGREDTEELFSEVLLQFQEGDKTAPRVVGETGLDWYRMYAPKEVQEDLFVRHLRLARDVSRPVIIHNRDADEDIHRCLRNTIPSTGGVMHCFGSNRIWMERFVDLGMYISFAGNVTYRSAEESREVLAATPRERLLLETDAPYLSPVPLRGKPNSPAYIGYLYDFVSDFLDTPVQDLVELVSENSRRLFRL